MLEGGAGAETVSVRAAACVRLLEVPVKFTVDVPTAALDAAVSVVLCAVPGVRVSELGLAVTPLGRPVVAHLTAAVKPLLALAVKLIADPAAPEVSIREAGEAVSV